MNHLNVLLIFGLLASASCVSLFFVFLEEWEAFKVSYAKKYDSNDEESSRMKIFAENKYKIAQHNQLYSLGLKSYSLKMNRFGDMLHEEFVAIMNGLRNVNFTEVEERRRNEAISFIEPDDDIVIPSSIDWRDKGAVTEVKDQLHCGSCYTFSATGSLEGQHFRKTGNLVSLSEQNLVDCTWNYGNQGCEGGYMDGCFRYIKDNHGVDREASYPYKGDEENCRFNKETVGAEDKGYVYISKGDEEALLKAVATIGPISVAIDASMDSFKSYDKGVYYEANCSSINLDHAVLVVGYGVQKNGTEYWLVKNSWGTDWGLDGYIKMSRNRGNNCGIATMASYPVV